MPLLIQLYGLLSVLLRAGTLGSQSLTIGGIFFLLLVVERSQSDVELGRLRTLWWVRRWAVVLVGVQFVSLLLNTVILIGVGGVTLSEVIGGGFFRAGIVAIASALVIALARPDRKQTHLLIPAALILASSVLTSHAISRLSARLPLLLLTASHQGATAAWIGGLPYLLLSLKQLSPDAAQELSARFSRLAQISVGVLITAGTLLARAYLGSWGGLYGTSYGVMLAAKGVLFAFLLLLGFLNFRLVRVGVTSCDWILTRLKRLGEVEITVGFSVILAAASLTSLPPAVDLATTGLVARSEILTRFAPQWPGFYFSRSYPRQEMYTVASTQSSWSEYNHHWAGLVVLAMGLLALIARGGMGWAQNWPLLLFALGVFIIYRADPENWPLGPGGFWASFADPEVLLHRLFAILIVVFGTLERKVQSRLIRERVGLVFPMVVSLAGALLLTHSHNLGNIKEEALAELSHTFLAVFAILAGSSRWLEVRLSSEDPIRRVTAWVWPLCLLLIGITLLDYREG